MSKVSGPVNQLATKDQKSHERQRVGPKGLEMALKDGHERAPRAAANELENAPRPSCRRVLEDDSCSVQYRRSKSRPGPTRSSSAQKSARRATMSGGRSPRKNISPSGGATTFRSTRAPEGARQSAGQTLTGGRCSPPGRWSGWLRLGHSNSGGRTTTGTSRRVCSFDWRRPRMRRALRWSTRAGRRSPTYLARS